MPVLLGGVQLAALGHDPIEKPIERGEPSVRATLGRVVAGTRDLDARLSEGVAVSRSSSGSCRGCRPGARRGGRLSSPTHWIGSRKREVTPGLRTNAIPKLHLTPRIVLRHVCED